MNNSTNWIKDIYNDKFKQLTGFNDTFNSSVHVMYRAEIRRWRLAKNPVDFCLNQQILKITGHFGQQY